MPEPYVREIGYVKDLDDCVLTIGVDYDAVTIGLLKFSGDRLEILGQLFVAAVWAAGHNKARMEEEAGEAVTATIDALRARLAGDDA